MTGVNLSKIRTYALLAAAALVMMAMPSLAQQQSTGDPVADAARKAREQKRKNADKPKKVYTDEDVNHAIPETPASGDRTAEGGDKATSKGQAAADGKDAGASKDAETQWRKRFQEAHAKLAQLEKELDILQREDNKAQLQYYSDPQKAMEEQYTRKDINEKDAKIAAKKKEIEQMKQQISDMEDDLRKSGGDPGWARP